MKKKPGKDFEVNYTPEQVPTDEAERKIFFRLLEEVEEFGNRKKHAFFDELPNKSGLGFEEVIDGEFRVKEKNDRLYFDPCSGNTSRILLFRPNPAVNRLFVVRFFGPNKHDAWDNFVRETQKKHYQLIKDDVLEELTVPTFNILEGENGKQYLAEALDVAPSRFATLLANSLGPKGLVRRIVWKKEKE